MGVERVLNDMKVKKVCELQAGKAKRNRRRQKKTVLPVRKLFDTCKEVFSFSRPGFVPPPDDVHRLRLVLDGLKPEDVGLNPDMPYFKKTMPGKTPIITYLHLHECKNFSIGIFCLPPSAVIPLHNHPEMTVFSKLLMGSMHIKSYDWEAETPSLVNGKFSTRRLAKVKVDNDFHAPCGTSILYPNSGGNMHRFTALTACAVLDVLAPPYSDPDGRHCTYYSDFPLNSDDCVLMSDSKKENRTWLEERDNLEDLVVVGAEYKGPKIVES